MTPGAAERARSSWTAPESAGGAPRQVEVVEAADGESWVVARGGVPRGGGPGVGRGGRGADGRLREPDRSPEVISDAELLARLLDAD
jgi:hypothetical protein